MAPSEDPDAAIAELVERVKTIVAEGSGADDEDLLAAFREWRRLDRPDPVAGDLAGWRARVDRIPAVVPYHLPPLEAPRTPGRTLAQQLVVRATRRQTDALLEQLREVAHQVKNCLLEVRTPDLHYLTDALEHATAQLEAIGDTVAALEGRLSATQGRLEVVEGQLELLNAAEAARRFQPWFAARDFDDEFRGDRKTILDRYHDLADILAAAGGPVVDLGCGRGEMVELLATRGIQVWGAEITPELVEFCRSIYLDVRLADAHSALRSQEDASLGGAALIQVVEHLSPQQLVDLLPLLAQKVRPGGVVVAETVNATSPYVFTHSFYLDPTHHNPVHPDYLMFLFRHAGFAKVDIQWRSEVPDSDLIVPVRSEEGPPELIDQINATFHRLDRLLFGPQDYAVVAVR